jgi:hypothetical protein
MSVKIKLYTTGCSKCRVLEGKLSENNVPFNKVDDKDRVIEKAMEFVVREVPFCTVDGVFRSYNSMMAWLVDGEFLEESV